jgi:hypothetical protein
MNNQSIYTDTEIVQALRQELHSIMRTSKREMDLWDHKRIYRTMLHFIEGRTGSPRCE